MFPLERDPFKLWQILKFNVTILVKFCAALLVMQLYEHRAP